jgi:hypothetical protein
LRDLVYEVLEKQLEDPEPDQCHRHQPDPTDRQLPIGKPACGEGSGRVGCGASEESLAWRGHRFYSWARIATSASHTRE